MPAPAASASVYEGYHDFADCDLLSGWAWDQNQPDAPVYVDVYSDGAYLLSVWANAFRADLSVAGKGSGVHAFNAPVPASIRDGQWHSIAMKYGGTSIDLYNTPKPLFCGAAMQASTQFEGYDDVADCTRIAGWAWDASQPDSPVSVDLYRDGVLFARALADLFRIDLRDSGKGNGVHGFDVATPAAVKDGQPHDITVRYAGTAQDLYWTPTTLVCVP